MDSPLANHTPRPTKIDQSKCSSSTADSPPDCYVLDIETMNNEEIQEKCGCVLDEKFKQRYKELYKLLHDGGIDPQLLNVTDCETKRFHRNDVLILPTFSGSIFGHVYNRETNKMKCSIYGPPICFKTAQERKSLPKLDTPIYSLAMNDCVVTFSQITNPLRVRVS